jgi:hypothetical protein
MSTKDSETPALEAYDDLQQPRCPSLGQVVPFKYCRSVHQGGPCPKTVVCWGHRFDVMRYLRVHFTEEQLAPLHEPPTPKVEHLVDLIERARNQKPAEEQEPPEPPSEDEQS